MPSACRWTFYKSIILDKLTFCVTLIPCDMETYIMGGLTIPIGRASLEGTHIRTLEAGTWDDILLGDFMESYASVRREQKKAVREIADHGQPAG